MKRLICLLLTLLLLTGCTAKPVETAVPETTAAETVPTAGENTIDTVDKFLAAIRPGASIQLEAGSYLLQNASDYGSEDTGEYYSWTDLGAGDYQLEIHAEDLMIRGSREGKTLLQTSAVSPHVLVLDSCKNVLLTDMTIGHVEQAEACQGGVVYLRNSENVRLEGLNLYGCGSVGLWAETSRDVTAEGCQIYDCSLSGLSLNSSQGVRIRDCVFHSLGGEDPAPWVMDLYYSWDVEIEGCTIKDNYVYELLYTVGSDDITFLGNSFVGNRIATAAFTVLPGVTDSPEIPHPVVMVENSFLENELRSWYGEKSVTIQGPNGEDVVFPEQEGETAAQPGPAEPVSTGEQTQVRVKTVDEFLAAIGPDTEILLEAGDYALSQAADYGGPPETYYHWEDNFDGPQLVISGVENLTIRGAGMEATAITAAPRYANVLSFRNCRAITLSGFTAGHSPEEGYCMGGVLNFSGSEELLVEGCGLFGCGTWGIQGEYVAGLQVADCEIYECSYGGIWLRESEDIAISGTTFRDLGGSNFALQGCRNVTLDGHALDGNYSGN